MLLEGAARVQHRPLAAPPSPARVGQSARLERGARSARHAGELPLGAPRQSNKAHRARVTTTQRYGATGGELPLGAPPHPQRHALARWHACQPQQPRLLPQLRGESALSLGAHARATHGPRSHAAPAASPRARSHTRLYASWSSGGSALSPCVRAHATRCMRLHIASAASPRARLTDASMQAWDHRTHAAGCPRCSQPPAAVCGAFPPTQLGDLSLSSTARFIGNRLAWQQGRGGSASQAGSYGARPVWPRVEIQITRLFVTTLLQGRNRPRR